MENDVLLDIKFDTSQALQNIKDLTDANARLKDELKALSKGDEDYAKKQAVITAQMKENSSGIRENTKEIQVQSAAVASAETSINGMRARVADLTRAYNSMSKEMRESEAGKQVASEMLTMNDSIKKANSEVGNFKDNVGNYKDAMTGFGGAVNGLIPGFGGVAASIGSMTKSAMAFIATPFGAVLAAIVVVLASLKAAFTSSEEGQDKWNKVMTITGALLGNLMDVLASLGEMLISTFENPQKALSDFGTLIKENIVNRFEGLMELIPELGKAIGLLFKGEFSEAGKVATNAMGKVVLGVENVTEKVGDAIDAVKEFAEENMKEAKQAAAVADMRAKADKIDRDLLVNRAKIEADVAEARSKAMETEIYSAKERKQFLIDADKLRESLFLKEQKSAKLKYEAQKLENTFSRTNKENLDKEAQALAALSNIEANRFNEKRTLQKQQNKINKEIEAEEKQAIENAIKNLQEQLKMEALIEADRVAGKKLSLEEQSNLQLAQIQRDLDAKLKENSLRLAVDANYVDQSETLRLEASIREKELRAKTNEELAKIDKENQANLLADQLELATEGSKQQLELQKEQLEEKRKQELSVARLTAEQIAAINAKYDKASRELEKKSKEYKLDMLSRVVAGAAQLFGESTAAGKAAASAEVAIETYKGAMKTGTSAAEHFAAGNIPLGILASAETGIVIASGVKAISDIWSVKDGNGGSSSAGGGVSSVSAPAAPTMPSITIPSLSVNPTLANQAAQPAEASATSTDAMVQAASNQPQQAVLVTDIIQGIKQAEIKENLTKY